MLRPLNQPSSRSPCSKFAMRGGTSGSFSARGISTPISCNRSIYWASAKRGQETSAPPSNDRTSRRLISSPRHDKIHIVALSPIPRHANQLGCPLHLTPPRRRSSGSPPLRHIADKMSYGESTRRIAAAGWKMRPGPQLLVILTLFYRQGRAYFSLGTKVRMDESITSGELPGQAPTSLRS